MSGFIIFLNPPFNMSRQSTLVVFFHFHVEASKCFAISYKLIITHVLFNLNIVCFAVIKLIVQQTHGRVDVVSRPMPDVAVQGVCDRNGTNYTSISVRCGRGRERERTHPASKPVTLDSLGRWTQTFGLSLISPQCVYVTNITYCMSDKTTDTFNLHRMK